MFSVIVATILCSCQKNADTMSEHNASDSIPFASEDGLNEMTGGNTSIWTSPEHVMTKEEYNSSEEWYSEFWADPAEYYRFYHQAVVKSKKRGISLDSVLHYYSHSELPYDSVMKWYTNDPL